MITQKEMMKNQIDCSVGVMAYNEEKNICHILNALLKQDLEFENPKIDKFFLNIVEIIVVSSGSTDDTDKIVESFMQKYPKIKLIKEEKRSGKSSAINLFIKESTSDILIVESADTIPEKKTVQRLISPFINFNNLSFTDIGMTGARPVPVNTENTFTGYAVNLLWRLHHKMALFSPKLGEMIAFRKVFESIPAKSAVDEASIEALITQKNLKCHYVPDAVVKNKGPETISDFIKQRRRIATGHLWLKKNQNYSVASGNITLLVSLFLMEVFSKPKDFFKIVLVAKLELLCRLLAFYDYYFKKDNPFIWEMIKSSKKVKG